jgi:hypothetical protein
MLEFKSFGEVDLKSKPIVVLSCGHFFTAETLDGHVGIAHVYETDPYGEFVGLRNISEELTQSIPRCPNCQCPIRQHATQRYNRVINRAVIDEMSKRFLVSGKAGLQALESEADNLELELGKSREELLDMVKVVGTHLGLVESFGVIQKLESRFQISQKLAKDVTSFLARVADKDQPARKLYDATVRAIRAKQSLGEQMEQFTLNGIPMASRDQRVILGGRVVQLKVEFVVLADKLEMARNFESILDNSINVQVLGSDPVQLAASFFESCGELIGECDVENLPRSSVEVRLYYSRIARLYQSYSFAAKSPDISKAMEHVKCAKIFLLEAKDLCARGFQNANALQGAVEETLKLLGKEWYEPVSENEIATIKAAMVSGAEGISTHSGHWYNCRNGHPVSPAVPLVVLQMLILWRSLPWVGVGCQWRKPVVQNAGPLSEDNIICRLQG